MQMDFVSTSDCWRARCSLDGARMSGVTTMHIQPGEQEERTNTDGKVTHGVRGRGQIGVWVYGCGDQLIGLQVESIQSVHPDLGLALRLLRYNMACLRYGHYVGHMWQHAQGSG